MIKIYIDAATHQTKNISAGGMIVLLNKEQLQIKQTLRAKTNNEAEFEILLFALEFALNNNWNQETIFIYSDSQIVIQSLEKKYAKEDSFSTLLNQILTLMNKFDFIFIEWQGEKQNKGADNLARQALQLALKNKSR
ncbi:MULTISPECIES: ribonuclease HI family protein [Vagococcus]|uniref:Ribonuclease HI, Bacillus nonfunctional homolog n=1 Tax=Vagococcus fluvialis bH819 TaxID=1255619 RepID=A0A1X6WS43_9ENTE|nr:MULTISPECIES: ribonuclease HI family protein [Vagococcus]SLM87173.1 Ribonuclease HI, Bacillus nonfunctional homolog [Vagococcus fluvialis bH819]